LFGRYYGRQIDVETTLRTYWVAIPIAFLATKFFSAKVFVKIFAFFRHAKDLIFLFLPQ